MRDIILNSRLVQELQILMNIRDDFLTYRSRGLFQIVNKEVFKPERDPRKFQHHNQFIEPHIRGARKPRRRNRGKVR